MKNFFFIAGLVVLRALFLYLIVKSIIEGIKHEQFRKRNRQAQFSGSAVKEEKGFWESLLTPKYNSKAEAIGDYGEKKFPLSWRLDRTQIIKTLLAPGKIDQITAKDVKDVVMCLHCLSSYPINRTKFLNPQNNSLADIRDCWKHLLHTGPITRQKIDHVTSTLNNFGISSVQELIGWYYPDKYPLMNSNSDCGMRFFGYNIV